MKRSKRHRVKQELPETSSSRTSIQKEHDLAYYIHDRVELMHQVFSVLKPKELKAMAPECVRHISISDLQELCMEELLGISSKRLCAILDGASPPSDTESSSESEQLETISLDSISSDEEILSQVSSTKKSKKHKHHSKSKTKKRKSKNKDDEDKDQADRSRRAGLTVLELLELQARARAIRAQLQQEQAAAVLTDQPSGSVTGNSSDEVEIKEEAAEVVEISSEDEKPNIQELDERIAVTRKNTTQESSSNSKTVTKKVNDLIITVPKTNTSRKIKLKRNTSSNLIPAEKILNYTNDTNEKNSKSASSVIIVDGNISSNAKKHSPESKILIACTKFGVDAVSTQNSQSQTEKASLVNTKDKNKSKDKKKKRKKDKPNDKDGSDHDEIMLQLSDTEKMDLLEDLEGKKSEKCIDAEDSTSDSDDDESCKGDSDEDNNPKSKDSDTHNINVSKDKVNIETCKESERNSISSSIDKNTSNDRKTKKSEVPIENKITLDSEDFIDKPEKIIDNYKGTNEKNEGDKDESNARILDDSSAKFQPAVSVESEGVFSDKNATVMCSSHDIQLVKSDIDTTLQAEANVQDAEMKQDQKNCDEQSIEVDSEDNNEKNIEELCVTDKVSDDITGSSKALSNSESIIIGKMSTNDGNNTSRDDLKEKSDGELSDRDSSEVEASDFKPDVVCISDDEEKKGKKKKKKDKKSKKEKKNKKKKDFRENGDQNFYRETIQNFPDQPSTEEHGVLTSEVTGSCYSSPKYNRVAIENMEILQSKDSIIVLETERNKSKDVKLHEIENFKSEIINIDTDLDDDVLEFSDDSSCYEVEEISISKEPTAKELEALSAKLDELERDRTIDIGIQGSKDSEELVDNVSWKDRYLKSSKVKKVLTTANIMNAMRKKNLELKKKLQESKKETEIGEKKNENIKTVTCNFEDGSIEQYNTLEASTKYVDPVKEPSENTDNATEIENGSEGKVTDDKNVTDNSVKSEKDAVTKEMKKEAKQLLKMYKMLLKYNDMSKQKDPNKKRKKKKKSKDKDKDKISSEVVTTEYSNKTKCY